MEKDKNGIEYEVEIPIGAKLLMFDITGDRWHRLSVREDDTRSALISLLTITRVY